MKLSPVPDRPSRIVLYVRVSSVGERVGERFHSPDLQAQAVRQLAEARGMTVVEVVEDLDVSGRTFARDGIRRVMELAKAGAVDAVGLYDLSRLGRNTAESLRTIAELRDMGVSIVSTVEQIDDSPEGQFMLGQFLGMAQLYSDQIGRRWQQIHDRRHQQGLVHAGKVPLGYRLEDGKAVVDPVLGPLVEWAFRAYLAGTVSQKQIAVKLTQARGRLVRQGTVSNLLRNPFHAGQVKYRRQHRPGTHKPLIDMETFEAVQRKLTRDLTLSPSVRGPVTFSTGMLHCATCKRLLNRRGRGREVDDHRPRLRCPTVGCPGVGAPFIADVEQALLTEALRVAQGYADGAPAVLARQQAAAKTRTDQARLRDEQAALRKSLDRATERLDTGILTDEEYLRFAQPRRDRLAAVEREIGDLEDAPVRRPISELRDAAARLELRKDRMTALELRAAVQCFVERAWLSRAAYRGQPVAERLRYPD
jgi:DNA invertase Pin-like site-specific DNA recombinase